MDAAWVAPGTAGNGDLSRPAVARVLEGFGEKGIFAAGVPEDARAARPLALLDPRAWITPAPPRQWIVPDWIPRATVTALYGDGGVGKSLLAQQLLTCTALGEPWLGLEVAKGRALGIFCEDDAAELQRRQEAINHALGTAMADLGDLRLMSRLGDDNVLMDFTGSDTGVLTDFFNDLDATMAKFRPALAALDTAADLFGGNENVRPQVRRFVGACLGRLALRHDCAVLLLAHPSSAGLANGSGTGGSTAWNNTVRSRLYLDRQKAEGGEPADPDARLLSRMKANYAPADARIDLRWQRGAFCRPDAASHIADPATWPAIHAMFDEMERAWAEGRAWSYRPETRRGGRYFPSWSKKHLGIPEARCVQLLAGWLETGCLRFEMFDAREKTKGLRVVRRPDQ